LVTCCFGPFLCKGVTFASFQVFGIFLVSIDFWNILVSGSAMFFAVSFRNFGCIWLNKFFPSVFTIEDTTQGIPIFPPRTDQKLEKHYSNVTL
jgi:hypothetical protein